MSHAITSIVAVNCKRLRALIRDPDCWNAGELLFVIDRLEDQHSKALKELKDAHKSALAAAVAHDCDGPSS